MNGIENIGHNFFPRHKKISKDPRNFFLHKADEGQQT